MRAELFSLKGRTVIPAWWRFVPAVAWIKRIADETEDGVYRYNSQEARNHD